MRPLPDPWSADADRCDLGVELEVVAVQSVLAALSPLPTESYLAVKANPSLMLDDCLAAALAACDASRVVVELTEHTVVDDHRELLERLKRLRWLAMRAAVDDTGAGISSFGHIVRPAPDLIKQDRFPTSGIDRDPVRRSLAAALVSCAVETGAKLWPRASRTSTSSRRYVH